MMLSWEGRSWGLTWPHDCPYSSQGSRGSGLVPADITIWGLIRLCLMGQSRGLGSHGLVQQELKPCRQD